MVLKETLIIKAARQKEEFWESSVKNSIMDVLQKEEGSDWKLVKLMVVISYGTWSYLKGLWTANSMLKWLVFTFKTI